MWCVESDGLIAVNAVHSGNKTYGPEPALGSPDSVSVWCVESDGLIAVNAVHSRNKSYVSEEPTVYSSGTDHSLEIRHHDNLNTTQ